ncbi:PE-PPE domain-containing protein [Mycolicibacterium sp. GCM10028919]|uniref:PE-PPE domain-containing protein n=1 Tax=Mycolicibacterium sp. GCM10028919 TaxID=3273401 RepID=UPI00361722B4
MRKTVKAVVLAFIALLGSIALTIGSAFSAALAFGAIGLLVPGTGTPNGNTVWDYLENARDWYMQGTACNSEANCGTVAEGSPDPTLVGIDYPASFWPLKILPTWCRSGPDGCDKWDVSVDKGVLGLSTALDAAFATPGTPGVRDIVVFGYSQGGDVVSTTLNGYGLTDEQKARLDVITIGGIENPDGGLWQRLGFLRYIPILDLTFGPPMPVDPNIKTTTFGFEYDPVVYAPRYWGNPFAMLNAFAAFDNVHGEYLSPNGNGPTDTLPYGYTPATLAPHLVCTEGVNCRKDQYGNEYIMIPATSLPIMNLVMSLTPGALKPLVKPIVDLISPAYKVLADLGYDWSGNPGTPTPLSILPFNPFQNWGAVGVKLVAAVIQGIQDAINGGPTIATPAPLTDTTSTLAARSITPQGVEAPEVDEVAGVATEASVTELSSARKSTPETAAESTPASSVASPEPSTGPVVEADPVEQSETKDDGQTPVHEAVGDDATADEAGTKDDDGEDTSAVTKDDDKDASEQSAPQKSEPQKSEPQKSDDAKDGDDGSDAGSEEKKAA